jgi:hypothetical protein
MKSVFALAAALLAVSPAAAFDNTTCKAFLAGTWNGGGEHDMGGHKATVTTHSVYKTDGSFSSEQTMAMEGQAPMTRTVTGTWDAKPGPEAGTCEASITAAEFGTQTIILTVVDDDTVTGPDGNVSKRAAE